MNPQPVTPEELERARFEEWAKSEGDSCARHCENHYGRPCHKYLSVFTEWEWKSWQASARRTREVLASASKGGIAEQEDFSKPKVYVASRASVPERSAMWRLLRENGVNIVSSWIDEAGEGETSDFGELWLRICAEIATSDVLVLYAELGDFPLKGALIEVGVAVGMGKPIRIVAPAVKLEPRSFRPLGSWTRHPSVTFHESVIDAVSIEAPPTADAPKGNLPTVCPTCGSDARWSFVGEKVLTVDEGPVPFKRCDDPFHKRTANPLQQERERIADLLQTEASKWENVMDVQLKMPCRNWPTASATA